MVKAHVYHTDDLGANPTPVELTICEFVLQKGSKTVDPEMNYHKVTHGVLFFFYERLNNVEIVARFHLFLFWAPQCFSISPNYVTEDNAKLPISA